jgi:DNA-binding PadR family transcriptional regulator
VASGLTTTSYAILGQLALRPWGSYELANEVRRNIHYLWPRAERGIYAEVKRLADRGLARAERGFVGRRPRTTYAITPDGRAALECWLSTPPSAGEIEFEALLRVLYAGAGTRDELLAAIESVRAQADEMLRMATRIRGEYLAGRAPFQEQVHTRALVFDFLFSHALAVRAWADRSRAEVERWQDLSSDGKTERALALIAAAAPPA